MENPKVVQLHIIHMSKSFQALPFMVAQFSASLSGCFVFYNCYFVHCTLSMCDNELMEGWMDAQSKCANITVYPHVRRISLVTCGARDYQSEVSTIYSKWSNETMTTLFPLFVKYVRKVSVAAAVIVAVAIFHFMLYKRRNGMLFHTLGQIRFLFHIIKSFSEYDIGFCYFFYMLFIRSDGNPTKNLAK